MSMEYLDWFFLCLRFRKKMTHPSAYWPSNLKIYKHSEWSELCLLALECANPQEKWAKRAMLIDPESANPQAQRAVPIDPWICKSTSTASETICVYWPPKVEIHKHSGNPQAHPPSNLQMHKHSERCELCSLTLKSTYPQTQRVKWAVPIDPRMSQSTSTSSKSSCAHWPSNLQIYKQCERSELCPLTLKFTNPQAQRAKRAVSFDSWICKSKSTASEASCAHWPSNLQTLKHSERREMCPLTLESAQAQPAKLLDL